MSKLIKIRDAVKKASKKLLQLTICGTVSAFIMSVDAGFYAMAVLGGLIALLAVGTILANVVYDDEMRVRFMRHDSKGKLQFYV